MSLCKRNNIWWIRFSYQGERIQRSAGTSDKVAAQELHDKFKAELWRTDKLKEKPTKTWIDAVVRWTEEMQHKRSIKMDKIHLRWLDSYLKHRELKDISRDLVDEIAKAKEKTGVKPATVNRMLALIRSILRKAEREWEWLDKSPTIRMRVEEKGRIRWLARDEANLLLQHLPIHLADMAAFTLATGLRCANVTGLEWQAVDLTKRHALVHPDQAKAKKAIPVPVNADAMAILQKQIGKHDEFVFVYKGKHIVQCNTKAWRKALRKANINNFRWHDLRHTWASWHVQNGTSLQELQQLGGWSSYEMVLRYAHLSSDHLKEAAERISGANLVQLDLVKNQESR